MPRRGKVPKREIISDALYNSMLVQRFINKMMYDGKKSLSEKILYKAMDNINSKLGKPPIEIFEKAINNIRPLLEVKARRVGGATYQIPVEVTTYRGQAIAIRWLIDAARNRNAKSMIDGLTAELIDASNMTGGAAKKKDDLHKTAEANKAFAHFRW